MWIAVDWSACNLDCGGSVENLDAHSQRRGGERCLENLYAYSRSSCDDSREIVIRDDSLILAGRDSQGSMIRIDR